MGGPAASEWPWHTLEGHPLVNNPLNIASSESDAAAATAIEQHHAQLAGTLAVHVETFLEPLTRLDGGDADDSATDSAAAARHRLVAWARTELIPHAEAEESVLYPVAHDRPEARLLVEAMLAEHDLLTDLVDEIATAGNVVRAGCAARAFWELFNAHVAKENDLLVPLLASAADVSLSELVHQMHDHIDAQQAPAGCGGHVCTCGEVDGAGLPELDARNIPHAIRHATIFGALDTTRDNSDGDRPIGLVLLAPHDPLPLLAQIQDRYPDTFDIEYLERGPDVWRLAFTRHVS